MAVEMDKAKGNIKKTVGELTGNDKMKTEGALDKLSGDIKSGVNKIKKALKRKVVR